MCWDMDSDDGLADEIVRAAQPPPWHDDDEQGQLRPEPLLDGFDDDDEEESEWEQLDETLEYVPPPPLEDPNAAGQEAGSKLPPRYAGEIKKVGAEYGFITCDETYQLCMRDVYIKRTDMPEGSAWRALQLVSFCLGFSEKGHPQAKHISTDEAMLSMRTCNHEDHFKDPTPPPSPKPEAQQPETPSSVAGSTPSRGAMPPRGESWADVLDEEADRECAEPGEPGREGGPPRQREGRRRRNGKGGHKGQRHKAAEDWRENARKWREQQRPLRSLPLYDVNARAANSPSRSESPGRMLPMDEGTSSSSVAHPVQQTAEAEDTINREVVEAGAAGSSQGTVPLAEAGHWIPALWSGVDLVRALCLQRPRDFLLKVEVELLRLLAAPRGTNFRLPALAPYYRALLRALCVRFGVQDTVAVRGRRRAITVTNNARGPRSRRPLPLSALVPGTWAGQDRESWTGLPKVRLGSREQGQRIRVVSDFTSYGPDSAGVDADGDPVDQATLHGDAVGHRELYLAPGKWKFLDKSHGETSATSNNFVLTFTVHTAQAGGGVGVALCGDPNSAWEPLQQILVGHGSRYSSSDREDVYAVLFKPCPMGGNWSVRFGRAEQAGEGQLQSAGVPLWKRDPCITFWLASYAGSDGQTHVDVGLDRFPWCRLFGVRLQQRDPPGFRHIALAALGHMQGLSLRSCRLERSVCPDWASRDHVVHLAWPQGAAKAPPAPRCEGLVAALDGGMAVCKSSSVARSLCSQAASQGWEARSLSTFPLDSFGAKSRIGAGTSATDIVRQRIQMVDRIGPRVSLQLGLNDWHAMMGYDEEHADWQEDDVDWQEEEDEYEEAQDTAAGKGCELSATAASFVPGGADTLGSTTLSADSPEFTPGAQLAASGLSAEAPTFTPSGYAIQEYEGVGGEGDLYGYGGYVDGYPAEAWPEGYAGDYSTGDYSAYADSGMRTQLSNSAAMFVPAGGRGVAREGGRGRRLRAAASEFRPQGYEEGEASNQQYGQDQTTAADAEPRWQRRTRGQRGAAAAASAPPAQEAAPKVRPPAYTDIRLKQQAEAQVRPPPYTDVRLKQQEGKREESTLDALAIKAQRPPPGYVHKSSARAQGAEEWEDERQARRREKKNGDQRGRDGWREGGWKEGWQDEEEEEEDEESEEEEIAWNRDKGGGSSWSKGSGKGKRYDSDDKWRDGWKEDAWRDDRRWRRDDWERDRWRRNDWDRGGWNSHSWKQDRWRQDDWKRDEGARRPPPRGHSSATAETARPPTRQRADRNTKDDDDNSECSGSSSEYTSSDESQSEDVCLRPARAAQESRPRREEPSARASRDERRAPPEAESSQGEARVEDSGEANEAEKEAAPKPAKQLPKANIVDKAAFHRLALGHLLGAKREPRQRRGQGAAELQGAAECCGGAADGSESKAAAEENLEAEHPECTAERPDRPAEHPECTAEGPE